MKDSFVKQIIIGIIGILFSIGLFALCIYLKNQNKLITGIILTMATSCGFGSLMYILDDIHGFLYGAMYGAAFTLSITLMFNLPKPFDSIFCAVCIILLITVPKIKEYLFEREENSSKPKIKKIAKQIKENKELENKIKAENKELLSEINIGEKSLILRTSGGYFYQCIKGEDKYYFIYIGGDFKGVDLNCIISDFSDEKVFISKKKDFIINKYDISFIKYNAYILPKLMYSNSGSIIMQCKNSNKRFQILDNIPKENVKMFFEGIRINVKSYKKVLPIAEVMYRKNKKFTNILKVIYLLLTILSASAVAIFLFLKSNYEVMSILCMLLFVVTFMLYVIYNDNYSIDDSSSKVFLNNKINITAPMFITSIGLVLRSLIDFHLFSYKKLFILSLVVFIIYLFVFFRFTHEYKIKKSSISIIIAIVLCFAPAVVVQTNHIFDNSDSRIEPSNVYDMSISTGSRGLVLHSIKVSISNGQEVDFIVSKEEYENLSIGCTVYIVQREGFLKIPYAYLE